MGEKMNQPTIEEILAPKPQARPRIYAYSIDDPAHAGLLKVGQTTRNVKQRVAEQLKTANIKNYTIELDESAERDDGSIFSDFDVRAALVRKGFQNVELEWVRCAVKDVQTVLTELRTGKPLTGTHHATFPMRREQADAVNKTCDYFQSIWPKTRTPSRVSSGMPRCALAKPSPPISLPRNSGRSACWWSRSSPP